MSALWELERIAARDRDGHLTVFRFTTGWKAFLGTVDAETDRDAIWARRSSDSLEAACAECLRHES